MTIEEFRKDGERVARMRAILSDSILQEWFVALRTSGPENRPIDSDVTPHFAHIRLGESRGYAKALNDFLLGGIHPQKQSVESAALKLKEEK